MNKMKKMIIGIFVILVLIIIVGLGFIGNYFYNLALNPKTSKEIIFGSEEEEEETSGEVLEEDIDWLLNKSNATDEYITSKDNLKLHSYKLLNEKESNTWVISVHGYTSEAIKLSSYARNFYKMGYNVLLPDLRSHGKSDGDYIGMGWDDRLDIIEWINYILEDEKDAKIILHGISMGAATVTMVSGEDLPTNVKAIVADCGYTSVWNQFAYKLKDLFKLGEFPIMHVSSLVGQIRAGYSIKEASSLEQVKKSKTPVLYIHGDKDDFVPYFMMEELYNATASEKEMITVEGAAHAKASSTNPNLYWTSIDKFIDKYVNN